MGELDAGGAHRPITVGALINITRIAMDAASKACNPPALQEKSRRYIVSVSLLLRSPEFCEKSSPYQRAFPDPAASFLGATKTLIAASASFRDGHASAAEFPAVATRRALLPGRALLASNPLTPVTVDIWKIVYVIPVYVQARITHHIQAVVAGMTIRRD